MRPFLLHQLLFAQADRTPDAPALIEPKTTLSYAALSERVRALAAVLAQAGVGPGDLVGLWSEKTSAAVAALYAISACGAAYVPIDPAVPRARAALVLSNVGARVIVTTQDRLPLLREMLSQGENHSLRGVVLLDGDAPLDSGGLTVLSARTGDAARFVARDVTDSYLAYVLHTSGSTGVPKGVAISHRNAFAFIEPAADYFAIERQDRLGCQAPLHFDLSVFDLFCAAHAGAAVVLFPEYFSAFPSKMAKAIDEHGVTVWNSVVSALALLFDKGKLDACSLASLRAVVFSGERMPMPLLRRIRARLPQAALYNVYGQTEANSSMAHLVRDLGEDVQALPLGETLPNFETFLIDEQGHVLGEAEAQGELCVRAATVAAGGYLRDEERSRDKFVLDPARPETGMKVYRTGDLARREASGQMFLVGRRDNMVKTRGFRVELGEIEVAIERVVGVGEVAVVAVPDPAIGHALVAYVEPTDGAGTGLEAEITSALGSKLPAYMVPGRVVVRAGLPRTSTGKLDRKALAAAEEP